MQGIIFDMDGVLIFSENAHTHAFQEACRLYLKQELSLDDYRNFFMGKTDRAGWQDFCISMNKNVDIDLLVKEVSNIYVNLFDTLVEVNWIAVDVMKQLAKEGYPVAITSSSTRREVDLTIRLLNLNEIVQVSISADEVVQGKPHPEPYLLTAKMLGALPSELIVIEDSPSGLASARSAGMKCIALTTTHFTAELESANLVLDQLSVDAIFELFSFISSSEEMNENNSPTLTDKKP